ncbi:glycosyltransferase family 2 protein [Candidatus Beckwithbacteria bacterium CG10_big_fil_rev_8_21_14_0_10_34_10]|uniref:Glycosyltransferase family 2 protein n=1 Tax=Candidatus Beckwithbacteria bacterium CG10_big_fil_rev_8_21_14_0_10_34_10 TaxID=1974495 RepID=A0A2H0WBS1_9BACT|nr:MAG: glycosyltransferase family 2 protein [Candidatus Beckwithbacteria bacterium CG10_big_fil_rev_8_21_14_0_10_34_10]
MRKNKLSVVLATHNEEKNIKDCLSSIEDLANEIVIIDGSSTDKTREIARNLGARIIKTSNKLMFHKNKQMALEKASGSWILQLDADERVSQELGKEIKTKISGGIENINGYYIPRKNYFFGRWLKKGGQYPDYVIRLVKKGKASFPCKTVHEQIRVEGEVDYLKNPLIHLASPNLASYLKKANIYTLETALKLLEKRDNKLLKAGDYLLVKPIFTFFSLFIRHKGFVDGIYGFLFALFSSLHFPLAFFKYLNLDRKKTK